MVNNKMTKIFIVGSARAGTTLLQSMFTSHPELTSFTESHFYSEAFLSRPEISFFPYRVARPSIPTNNFPFLKNHFSRNVIRRVEEFFDENDINEVDINVKFPSYEFWFPFYYKRISNKFISIFDYIADKRESKGWIEKTPRHLFYIPLIKHTVPEAKFVHIIRNGKENVASLYRMRKHWGPKPLKDCIYQWNRSIKTTYKRRGKSDDFVIVYEDLVRNPERELKDVCKKLGLSWSAEMLNYQQHANQIVSQDEPWKDKVKGDLKISKKFEETFDKKQQESVEKSIYMGKYKDLRNSN